MGWVLVLVVVLLVLAVGALVVSSLRRRDLGVAVGELSRETRRRDRRVVPPSPAPVIGKAVERAAVLERRGGAVELAPAAPPVPYVPPDPAALGVSRRQFFNRSIIAFMGLGIAGFGATVLGFLWPPAQRGGFGSKIRVGSVDDVRSEIEKGGGFYYRADGRMWITEYPAGSIEKAKAVFSEQELAGMEAGLVALYQKCPHLGCRVPECKTSQWFECPCHGSQYNRVGEKRFGPAPRGMDRFAMEIQDGAFVVNTGVIIQGPPIGVNTTGQEPEGPHCVGAAE